MQKISKYHNSISKKIFDYTFTILLSIITAPLFLIITLCEKLANGGPIFFVQKRIGKNGRVYNMIKFRTMIVDAEDLRNKLMHLNIADGPVFKIPNDPRYTRFGKILVKTGFDELPQFINILKGEMSLVGPRPLPTYEAIKLTKLQKTRELVLPGITSSWVISGAHNLKFKKWMELDRDYIQNAKCTTDIKILSKTAFLITKIFFNKIWKLFLLLHTQ